MKRQAICGVAAVVLFLVGWLVDVGEAKAQYYQSYNQNHQLGRLYYYPYYYFPHNYWPAMGPRWPEPPGAPYQPPPAYMAYPPFRDPAWRYELWSPQRYHRGNHFWLDIF